VLTTAAAFAADVAFLLPGVAVAAAILLTAVVVVVVVVVAAVEIISRMNYHDGIVLSSKFSMIVIHFKLISTSAKATTCRRPETVLSVCAFTSRPRMASKLSSIVLCWKSYRLSSCTSACCYLASLCCFLRRTSGRFVFISLSRPKE
jgi:hypothetical protein